MSSANDARELTICELQDISAGDRVAANAIITVWGGRLYIDYGYNSSAGAVLPVYRFQPQL